MIAQDSYSEGLKFSVNDCASQKSFFSINFYLKSFVRFLCVCDCHWLHLLLRELLSVEVVLKILCSFPLSLIPFHNHGGCWGTTDDFTSSFLHFSLFSSALWDLANSRPVHSLMLSSHFFFCLPPLPLPFTVPCKMVLARPDE